ncbi:MAG TPA: RteC domain-containing protein [Bacteroidales bacterium]
MLAKIKKLQEELETALKQIDNEQADKLKKAEQSIFIISDTLKQIKEIVRSNQFKNQQEEIAFFKEIKPLIFSKLIYFVKVFNIESRRPIRCAESHKKFLQDELTKLEIFFIENLEFYQYIRNNLTYLDDKYFVRGKLDLRLYVSAYIYDTDPEFSTSHDYKLAKLYAHDLLNIYLKTELSVLERNMQISSNSTVFKSKYTWTESKISLIELIYAIQASGCINNGAIDIKEIALFFESFFSLDLGDYYRTYLQIKSRQQPIKFLETLKASLIKKIEEQEF